MPKLLFVGDYAPGQHPVRLLDMPKADIVIGNMEGPLLEDGEAKTPSRKAGPCLSHVHAPPAWPDAEGESNAGCAQWVLSVANNHIMDFQWTAARNTCRKLEAAGCLWVGLGSSEPEARKPLFIESLGTKIAIIAIAEQQFGNARGRFPGYAVIGPWVHEMIRSVRREADIVVVSSHAALETSPLPTPGLRELYRSYIDDGADVIHGHHAHVPQLIEYWGGGVIMYGLGNFAVPPVKWRNARDGLWSMGLLLDWDGGTPKNLERYSRSVFFTVDDSEGEDDRKHIRVRAADGSVFHDRQAELQGIWGAEELYRTVWQETALHFFKEYGHSFLFQEERVQRHVPRDWPLSYHVVCCRSHREMLTEAMGILSGVIPYRQTAFARAYVQKFL